MGMTPTHGLDGRLRLSEPKTIGGRSVVVDPQVRAAWNFKEIRVSGLIKAKKKKRRRSKAMCIHSGLNFICVYETRKS